MLKLWKIFMVLYVVIFLKIFKDFDANAEKYACGSLTNKNEASNILQKGTALVPPPHFATVISKNHGSFIWCAGSVISKNHVLTAAHCLGTSYDVEVVLNIISNSEQTIQYTSQSKRIIRHSKWRPDLLLHDIALVELPQPPDKPDLTPIDLFINTRTISKLATVYGWGNKYSKPTLTKYQVIIISNEECAEYFGSLVTEFTFCTRSSGFGNGCHGFSGSGLVLDGYLVGVVSFGTEPCDVGYPTLYTNVSRYKKWIQKHTGG